jgi:chromosomal replication initiation ATPase DnaA
MPRQLTFDLGRPAALGAAHYVVAEGNTPVFAALRGWRGWPMGRMALCGPAGAGKTHLAHVWAGEAGAELAEGWDLTEAAVPELAAAPLALDEAEAVAGDPARERALFHLLNLTRETGQPLLLAGRAAPARWPVILPDLRSRLAALPLAEIPPPDDELLAALYGKLFADRQIEVGDGVVSHLVRHCERSFEGARQVVAYLDAIALEQKLELRLGNVRKLLARLENVME